MAGNPIRLTFLGEERVFAPCGERLWAHVISDCLKVELVDYTERFDIARWHMRLCHFKPTKHGYGPDPQSAATTLEEALAPLLTGESHGR